MMHSGFWGRLDYLARILSPSLATLLLLLLCIVPVPAPGLSQVMPGFVLISVYYWAIYRPDVLPMLFVFLVGFLHDALAGGAFGVHTLTYLVAYVLVSSQRRVFYAKSFGVVWWGFMLVAAGAGMLNWLTVSILTEGPIAPWPVFFSYLMTIALYPPVVRMLIAVHKTLPAAET